MIGNWAEKRRKRAYQDLFLDDDGKLKESAEIVMRDLANFSGMYSAGSYDDIPRMFGREDMFKRILGYVNYLHENLLNDTEEHIDE